MWNMKCMIIPVITAATRIVKRFKERFGSHTRKAFNRSTTKDSYTRNMTRNIRSTAI